MNCPQCNSRSSVIHTEKYDESIERVRKCSDCGQYFHTEEKLSVLIERCEAKREAATRRTKERAFKYA